MKGAKGADVFETMLSAFEDDSEVLGQQTQQQPDDKAADAWKTGGGILLSALQKGEQPPVCLAGRYHLIEQIGRGGMGEVWKAWDEREERLIALKQLHMRSSQDVRSQQRFARESRLLQSLKHKHIVELFDVAANDRFYTMELLEGWTLREYLRLRKRLTLFETIYILQQVTEGLFAAHHKGLIHRDLKPENIFLCADTSEHVTFMPVGIHDAPTDHSFASCQVKLLDFGIATMMDGTRLTSREGLVGTAYYISPEQMRGKKVTKAADLYSLGIILYEMLTGEVPVIGAPSIEASFSKREESKLLMPWECPSETKDTYHQHIEHIQALFSKLIRREPNERIALSHVSHVLKTCEADLLKERQVGAKARVKRLKELRLKASHAHFWTQLQKAEEAYPEKRNFQVLREEMKAIFAQVDEYARVLAEKLRTEPIEDCRVFWNEVCQREDLAGFCEGHSQAQSLARQERALMKRIRAVEHKLREDGPLACLTWIREDEFQSRQWMALCSRVRTLAGVYEVRTEALLRTDPILDAESVCDDWEHTIADEPDIRDFCLRHPHYLKARKQLSSKNERYRCALQLAEEGELEEALGQLQTLQLSLTSHEQAGEYGALLRRVEDAWETFQKDLVDTRRLLDDFATYTATTHWERCLQRATFPKAYEKLWDAIRHDELDDEPHTQMPPTSSQTSGRWRVFGVSVFIIASALFGWFGAMYMRNTDVFLHERAQRVASKAKGSSFDRLLVMLHRQHPQKVRRMIEKLVTSDESTTPLRVKTPGGKKGRRLSSHLLALRLFVGLKHKKVLFPEMIRLVDAPDPLVRSRALRVLSSFYEGMSSAQMGFFIRWQRHLADPDASVRREAIQAFHTFPNKTVLPDYLIGTLTKGLLAKDKDQARWTRRALKMLGAKAYPGMLAALQRGPWSFVRVEKPKTPKLPAIKVPIVSSKMKCVVGVGGRKSCYPSMRLSYQTSPAYGLGLLSRPDWYKRLGKTKYTMLTLGDEVFKIVKTQRQGRWWMKKVEHSHWRVRRMAIRLLGVRGHHLPGTVSTLLSGLHDAHRRNRLAAIKALGQLGMEPKRVLPVLATVLLPKPAPMSRPTSSKASVLREVRSSAMLREASLRAIKAFGPESLRIGQLVLSFLERGFWYEKSLAREIIISWQGEGKVYLRRAARASSWKLRRQAARLLGDMAASNKGVCRGALEGGVVWSSQTSLWRDCRQVLFFQVSLLMELLEDKHVRVRESAVRGLVAWREASLLRLDASLRYVLQDERTLIAALDVLRRMGMSSRSVRGTIAPLLKHRALLVRIASLQALGASTKTEELKSLFEHIREDEWRVRLAFVSILRRFSLQDGVVRGLRRQLLRDEEPEIQQATKRLLYK